MFLYTFMEHKIKFNLLFKIFLTYKILLNLLKILLQILIGAVEQEEGNCLFQTEMDNCLT